MLVPLVLLITMTGTTVLAAVDSAVMLVVVVVVDVCTASPPAVDGTDGTVVPVERDDSAVEIGLVPTSR